ncbi:sensor histidine kinase [Dethiobacter alkaliphilus]|uniref:sensor histidine kinase n=1 Tax=Dethiobacter alkaliphilus TaxID=427926 RepID=UPI002226807D|nr:sensor histidine kinase [Dethiobacter alkaliphilus]MCW3489706.1 sensor histidine kinase [Dethiobacter alkaliphilus]
MEKHFYRIFFIFVCFSVLLQPVTAKANQPEAVNGVLDLSDWSLEQDGIVALDGQWEFYWQELLTPQQFEQKTNNPEGALITVPRAWNSFEHNGKVLSGDGYATYRLLINTTTEEILGIKIPRIFTSYRLWANGELLAENGQTGIERSQALPQYLPKVKYINSANGSIELVLQVANFSHRSGGVLESLLIGNESQISELRIRNLALELFLFGSLFIIGFYHLALFSFRTKDKSTLYFGIYCLLIGFRTLLVGEIYFINLFPGFSWELAHKVQTLAYYLSVPLVFLFFKSVFPRDLSDKVHKAVQIIGLSFALLVILTPVRVFSIFNPFFQVFSLAVFLYIVYLLGLACYRRREGSLLISLGVGILILFAVNDIVFLSILVSDTDSHFLRSFVSRGNLSSWGLLIFAFTQSLFLARKFSGSFSKVEIMSEQLQNLNESLEEKVKARTHELETSRNELEEAYQAVSRLEKSRQHLVQNISHDLRTPLTSIQGYVSAILGGVVNEPQQQKKYLARVIDKVSSLNHMVQDLMELSQLESRQHSLHFTTVPVGLLTENIAEKQCFDLNAAKVNCHINYTGSWQENSYGEKLVSADMKQLDRVFSNLLGNAATHTPGDGRIDINFAITADHQLQVEIADTGPGIPQDDLPFIFERFYKVAKARQPSHKSSGLGLAIVKEIVEYHGGKIWAESEPDKGSSFFFTIPIHSGG